MSLKNHEYALRIARGCARGIALGDFNEFKAALRTSFMFETQPMANGVGRELHKAFEAFTSEDFVDLFTGSAYRPPTARSEQQAPAVSAEGTPRMKFGEFSAVLPDGFTVEDAVNEEYGFTEQHMKHDGNVIARMFWFNGGPCGFAYHAGEIIGSTHRFKWQETVDELIQMYRHASRITA